MAGRSTTGPGDDGMLIATKGRFAPPEGLAGASRQALRAAVDASLSRLGIDHIDLYLVHGWDQETPVAETLETLTGLAEAGKIGRVGSSDHGCSPGQVAIAWLLTRPTVSSVLLGARTLEQLDDNLGAADVTLSADDIARLTTISAPGLPDYPYAMLEEFAGMEHWHILGSAATI